MRLIRQMPRLSDRYLDYQTPCLTTELPQCLPDSTLLTRQTPRHTPCLTERYLSVCLTDTLLTRQTLCLTERYLTDTLLNRQKLCLADGCPTFLTGRYLVYPQIGTTDEKTDVNPDHPLPKETLFI